jgi:hypothetical protein
MQSPGELHAKKLACCRYFLGAAGGNFLFFW